MEVIVPRASNGKKSIGYVEPAWNIIACYPGIFDTTGGTAPALVAWKPGEAPETDPTLYKHEFALNNVGYFEVQLPSSYVLGSGLYVYLHWTPGAFGVAEDESLVGWKVAYTWANANGVFPAATILDLSDACTGVDHAHLVTPHALVAGSGKTMQSRLSCFVTRTLVNTGEGEDPEDTWVSEVAGEQPILLGVDVAFQSDAPGSVLPTAKFW